MSYMLPPAHVSKHVVFFANKDKNHEFLVFQKMNFAGRGVTKYSQPVCLSVSCYAIVIKPGNTAWYTKRPTERELGESGT